MRLFEFAVLYLLVGAGCALLVLVRRTGPGRFAEAPLVLAFWPLYGPFLLGARERTTDAGESSFLDALARVEGTPLAALLPDRTTVRVLSERLRQAAFRMGEIDRLLAQPGFSEADTRRRVDELERRGDERSAAAARGRLQNLERMRHLRDRFARELDEVRELLAQLRVQAEVLRLSGGPGDASRELMEEIVCRVEGLDAVLADETQAMAAPPEARA